MRKKIEIPVLNNIEAVDAALKRRCELQRELDIINLAMIEKIENAKKNAADEMAPLHKEAETLEMALEQYATHHQEEFAATRTKVLTFGTIGFRKTPGALKTMAKWTWEQVLAKLQELKFNKYIRTKPTVDKEAIEKDLKAEKINDENLAIMGLKWHVADEFFFTMNEETITAESAEAAESILR